MTVVPILNAFGKTVFTKNSMKAITNAPFCTQKSVANSPPVNDSQTACSPLGPANVTVINSDSIKYRYRIENHIRNFESPLNTTGLMNSSH